MTKAEINTLTTAEISRLLRRKILSGEERDALLLRRSELRVMAGYSEEADRDAKRAAAQRIPAGWR